MPTINFDNFNAAVKNWGQQTTSFIKAGAASAGITHRGDSPSKRSSVQQIKESYKFRDGAINKISFGFPRTLIFTHKGAGKGMAGVVGSRWLDKYGATKKTNPASMGKMDSGSRKAKPFFNKVIEAETGMNELATIAASELGDTISGNILIK